MTDYYERNASYYDRNFSRYEASSWYMFNKYKNAAVLKEIRCCLHILRDKPVLRVLEIGPGTGYLLGKVLSISKSYISYKGIEHSKRMSDILFERYGKLCRDITIINESVTGDTLVRILREEKFDLIMGSSILHHLLDYEQIVRRISGNIAEGGVLYFVREPIARDECQSGNFWSDYIEKIYCMTSSLLMTPFIRARLWPGKIKAEDTSNIAFHMFKDGISTKVFRELETQGFIFVFTRRYNRRVSSFLSYVENKWLAPLRKDIYGNTLFSICMRKV